MKLSDIKGDRAFDVVGDLITPIANIAIDEKAAELFTKKTVPQGKTAREFMIARIRDNLPALIKGHKTELCSIMSTIEGISIEEYKESLSIVKLIKDVTDLLQDEVFLELFT